MPIDPRNDELVTLAEAARHLLPRRNGVPVSPNAIWRWRTKGVLLPDGARVRLETVRCGRGVFTTAGACAEFIEKQSERKPLAVREVPAGRTAETERKLKDSGLL